MISRILDSYLLLMQLTWFLYQQCAMCRWCPTNRAISLTTMPTPFHYSLPPSTTHYPPCCHSLINPYILLPSPCLSHVISAGNILTLGSSQLILFKNLLTRGKMKCVRFDFCDCIQFCEEAIFSVHVSGSVVQRAVLVHTANKVLRTLDEELIRTKSFRNAVTLEFQPIFFLQNENLEQTQSIVKN